MGLLDRRKMAGVRASVQLLRQIGARQLSAGSSTEKLIKPPLQIYGIEGRYAHALFSAASRKNQLEKVEGDLGKMKDLLNQDKLLSAYLMDPSINKKQKQGVLEKATKEKKISELVEPVWCVGGKQPADCHRWNIEFI